MIWRATNIDNKVLPALWLVRRCGVRWGWPFFHHGNGNLPLRWDNLRNSCYPQFFVWHIQSWKICTYTIINKYYPGEQFFNCHQKRVRVDYHYFVVADNGWFPYIDVGTRISRRFHCLYIGKEMSALWRCLKWKPHPDGWWKQSRSRRSTSITCKIGQNQVLVLGWCILPRL